MIQLQKEKVELENKLEAEQEFIVNKLQKQLSVLNAEHEEIVALVEADTNVLRDEITEIMAKITSALPR